MAPVAAPGNSKHGTGYALDISGNNAETTRISKNGISADLPNDLFLAAGAGKQRLYIIPSLDLVIVRQGRQARFDDAEFLKRLLIGKT